MTVSGDEKKKILDKVRKLFALSKSCNENEAALATQRAKEMLEKYNLTISDVEVNEIIENIFDVGSVSVETWLMNLSAYISEGFDVGVYRVKGNRETNRRYARTSKIVFIGTDIDVTIANYVFEYLIGVIKNLADDYYNNTIPKSTERKMHGKTIMRGYRLGLVKSIGIKITAFAKEARLASNDKVSTGGLRGDELIVIKNDAIEKFKQDLDLTIPKPKKDKILTEAYNDGQLDGDDVTIHKGVNNANNGGTTKSIGG